MGAERQVSPKDEWPIPFSEVCYVSLGKEHQQWTMYSLSGEVRLWDPRGSDRAAHVWDLHPTGLSCFDVHPQTGLFATYVNVSSKGSSLGDIGIAHPLSSLPTGDTNVL